MEDSAYVPPSSLRDESGEKLRPEKRVSKGRVSRRVPRPRNENLRDPFHTLGDDEVHLIITLLPARDTETLRRVSKLWKASSEYHCGKSALVRRFPWAAAKANRCETREAANLQFRRCCAYNYDTCELQELTLIAVHYQTNLEAGFATRAIRFDGAVGWDLRENRLIWSKGDEEISIRDLRTPDDKSIIDSGIISLDISHLLPDKTSRQYVRIIPGGDFLVMTLLIKDDTLAAPKESCQLRRISAQGNVLWSVDLEASIIRSAIGKDSVYFIHGPWYEDDSRTRKISFAKHRLCDGSKVFDVILPPERQAHGKILGSGKPVLTENECLVLWKRNAWGELYIFSTASGKLLRTMDGPRNRNPPLLQSVAPSFHMAGFWTTTARYVTLTKYDEASGCFSDSEYYYADGDLHHDTSPMAFDGNHSVFLRTLHAPVGCGARDSSRLNPFAQFAVSPAELASTNGLESPEGTATVTLPARSKADGKRRDFELALPWELKEWDFFGMMNDYLIYQSIENEFLVLVDFWPVW